MKKIFILSLLCIGLQIAQAQETSKITFDGVVSPEEWSQADYHQVKYEFDPGDNIPSENLTDVYITYDSEYLLIGFIAYTDMSTLRSSIRNRDAAALADWLAAAANSDLASFVRGLRADEAAVAAALREPWSNGQTEGQINKLKMLKRQMYGRANLDLLRARLVVAA